MSGVVVYEFGEKGLRVERWGKGMMGVVGLLGGV